jgi:CRP-like cAMP-binding protein
MFVGVDRRLYSCLLELADRYQNGDGRAVVPLTQEHLAQFVGSTRGSVNEALQRLAAQRIVEIGRGRITVLDRAALRRKSGADA